MLKAAAKTLVLIVVVAVLHTMGVLTDAKEWILANAVTTTITTTGAAGAVVGTPDNADSYAFTLGVAHGWDTCSAIPIVINPAGAPAGAVDDMVAAVAAVAAASGLRMEVVGTTDAPVRDGWGLHQETGYPNWAPVLVGWAPPSSGLLHSDWGGVSYPVSYGIAGDTHLVSGMVVINQDMDASRAGGSGQRASRGALYEHELSHIAGLAHSDDPGQLMYATTAWAGKLEAGDLNGLKQLGAQPCAPAPAPAW
jgi:hypothetical protein